MRPGVLSDASGGTKGSPPSPSSSVAVHSASISSLIVLFLYQVVGYGAIHSHDLQFYGLGGEWGLSFFAVCYGELCMGHFEGMPHCGEDAAGVVVLAALAV